jgi:MFS family permease
VARGGDAFSCWRAQLRRSHFHRDGFPVDPRGSAHATDIQLGEIGSFFLWSYAIAAPFSGMLADRVSRSRLIAISLASWSLVMTLCGAVKGVEQLLALRVLLGIAESLYIPAAIALIADHHDPETRGTAMGIHLAGINLAVVLGGTLSGYLGEHVGWRAGIILPWRHWIAAFGDR